MGSKLASIESILTQNPYIIVPFVYQLYRSISYNNYSDKIILKIKEAYQYVAANPIDSMNHDHSYSIEHFPKDLKCSDDIALDTE